MAIESRIELDDQFGLGIIIIFLIGNFFGNFNVPREEIKGRRTNNYAEGRGFEWDFSSSFSSKN